MSDNNPYAAPNSDLNSEMDAETVLRLEKMAAGQKLVIYAVLFYFLAVATRFVIGPFALLFILASLIMSLVGIVKVLGARQSHIILKIVLFLLMFIPLINLLVLLSINSRATKTLRDAGYSVGFLGVKKQKR